MTFNKYVDKCIDLSKEDEESWDWPTLASKVGLMLNGSVPRNQKVKIAMRESEIVEEEFVVEHDIDGLIVHSYMDAPWVESTRYVIHSFNSQEHAIRRTDYGHLNIDGESIYFKDIPHTILFSNDSEGLFRGNIIFLNMYKAGEGNKQPFSIEDHQLFF